MVSVSHPLLLIGLDGATFDILDPLFNAGELPHLKRLCEEGIRTELTSTIPPITLPAWTSLMTGCGIGQHGVSDLLWHPNGDYALHPMTGKQRQIPTFLQHLSDMGLQVASVGVPGTFPPEQVNGLCIAGFDAPGAFSAGEDSVWPPDLYSEIQRMGGWQFATFNEHAKDGDKLKIAIEGLLQDLDDKERLLIHLLHKRPWDLFFVHLQASDTAGHHLWHTWDANSPRANKQSLALNGVLKIYQRLDRLIGKMLSTLSPKTRILVVSDHGMGGAGDTAIYLNRWLHKKGWLTFLDHNNQRIKNLVSHTLKSTLAKLPNTLGNRLIQTLPPKAHARISNLARGGSIDYTQSILFSDELDYNPALWLNREGVFKQGIVNNQAAENILNEVVLALQNLQHPVDHTPLFKTVHRRELTTRGPFTERLPDLILEPNWPRGYRPSFLRSNGPGETWRTLTEDEFNAGKGAGMAGVHRPEGILIAHGMDADSTEIPPLEIAQATDIIYRMLEVPTPDDVQERLPQYLNELFPVVPADTDTTVTRQKTAQHIKPSTSTKRVKKGKDNLLNRLKGLGYLE